MPNLQVLREYLLGEGLLEKKDLLNLLSVTTRMIKREPNVAIMQEPIFIIGDTHGQYFDLVHMFEKAIDGRFDLNTTSLLFLGDYVDRGRYGLEIVVFLYVFDVFGGCEPRMKLQMEVWGPCMDNF